MRSKKRLVMLLFFVILAVMLIAMLTSCKPPDAGDPPDDPQPPGEIPTDPSEDPSEDPALPSEQKQRDTYEVVTAKGHEDGPYLIETVYATEQTIIANVIVTPEKYGVDPAGQKDSTEGIQKALDDCYKLGGGTVFLPVGQYVVTKTIKIPYGVVLQGDWQDPDLTDAPEYGTVILAKVEPLKGNDLHDPTADPLFELLSEVDGNNGLIGLTVYYPEQDVTDVKPYGFTVYGERPRMVMLRDLTFINAYQGIGACLGDKGDTHELLQIENVRMTALSMGYNASMSREIGYTVDLRISPKYWSEAAEEFRCSDATALRDWCRESTVGLEAYSLDLNQYTDLYIESCHTALLSRTNFWGVFYGLEIKDCVYGFVAEGLNGNSGVTIANASIEADEYAVVSYVSSGAIKLADVQVTGKGGICSAPGAKIIIDNDDDLSNYTPAYGTYQKPASKLYVAEVEEHEGQKKDAAPAIQASLNAAAATGGIVYIPHGVYSVYTPLSVPAGVELRGAMPMAVRDKAASNGMIPGTVLLTYVNEGDFITLSEGSGVNGLRIFYPTYDCATALELLKTGDERIKTTVAIRGVGSDVYAVNMVISGALTGIDLTGCDGHLVKQTFGCAYNNFIRAGGKDGIIESVLCNMTYTMRQPFYTRGYFDPDLHSKAGWDLHKESNEQGFAFIRDTVLRSYCDAVYLIDAVNETLNNVFMYACHSILRSDHSQAVGYNVTTDWQGFAPMFKIENESDVVSFNPLRTVGKSHECDESSSLTLYNRLVCGEYMEPTYRSSSELAETAGGMEVDSITLLDCDSTQGTTGTVLNTDPTYIKQGKGSLKHDGKNPAFWLGATLDPVDISSLGTEHLFLHMWIYVSDPIDQIWGGNTLKMTTKNGSTYYWPTSTALSCAGWNEVWLSLDSGWRQADTQKDLSPITSISIEVAPSAREQRPDVYIDDISICHVLPYTDVSLWENSQPHAYQKPNHNVTVAASRIMINDCETLDYLSDSVLPFTEINSDPRYIKEGNHSIKITQGTAKNVFYEMLFPATDASDYARFGYLHMWIYFDRIDMVNNGGYVELTSSGTYDNGERSWSLPTYVKEAGWHELWLPLHEAKATGAVAFDPENVKYIRMYLNKGLGATTVYLDDIYLCNVIGGEYDATNTGSIGTTTEEELPILHSCDSLKGAQQVKLNENTEFIKEGKASLVSAPTTNRFIYSFMPVDISEYMDGYLHMWVYVENPQDLRSGYVELTSSGTYDKQEINWQLKNYLTQSGWNELMLPMFKPSKNMEFDPTGACYMRIYMQWNEGAIDHDVYFDDMRFVADDGN